MLVSVVVPTHNRSDWLRVTLRTVLWQQDVDLEAIVIDDGSTDDTAQTVADLGDGRVRLLRHEIPRGVSGARNHGAAEAQGEWVAFIDDDDLWAPEKLARQLRAAHSTGRSWVYTGSVTIDDGPRVIGGAPPPPPERVVELLPRYNVIPGGGSNVIVRRDALDRVGPFDPRLKNTEDWEMWIRLAGQGPPAWVREPLMAYRVHSANASLDIEAIFAGVLLIERRHGTKVDRGVLHRWIAESCLRTGQRTEALEHMVLAAVRGQTRHVIDDLFVILRRRLDRYRPRSSANGSRLQHPEWIGRARGWLEEVPITDRG